MSLSKSSTFLYLTLALFLLLFIVAFTVNLFDFTASILHEVNLVSFNFQKPLIQQILVSKSQSNILTEVNSLTLFSLLFQTQLVELLRNLVIPFSFILSAWAAGNFHSVLFNNAQGFFPFAVFFSSLLSYGFLAGAVILISGLSLKIYYSIIMLLKNYLVSGSSESILNLRELFSNKDLLVLPLSVLLALLSSFLTVFFSSVFMKTLIPLEFLLLPLLFVVLVLGMAFGIHFFYESIKGFQK
ncbi:MAG: hypothetical protein ABH821_04760 [archaeon]